MPQCASCPKKQSFLNPGDLCKDCYYGDSSQSYTTIDELELTKKVNDMTLGDIVSIIQQIVKPISEKLDKIEQTINSKVDAQNSKIELLKSSLKEKEQTIDTMSEIIINMQSSLNKIDSETRVTNLMISGLSENDIKDNDIDLTDDAKKVQRLFKVMEIDAEGISSEDTFEMLRIGQEKVGVTRLLKVNVQTKERRDKILERAKILKDKSDPWKKVYVKKDVHFVYAKENQRLNSKRKILRDQYPEGNIKIYNGKLLHDERVIDRNMFFR